MPNQQPSPILSRHPRLRRRPPSKHPRNIPHKHYPPPNIRDQLSPELEAEYEAALSDLSFDALMNQAAAGEVAIEIVPESRIKGRVARVHREDVFIDLGGRNQGVVSLRQFETPPEGRRRAGTACRPLQRRRRLLRAFPHNRRR